MAAVRIVHRLHAREMTETDDDVLHVFITRA